MSQIYDRARYDLLTGALPWLTTDVLLHAFTGAPVFDPTHDTMAEVIAANSAALGTSLPMTGMGATAEGVAQTDPAVIPNVPIGPNVTWFVLAKDSGLPLLLVDDAQELPFVPNGLDLVVSPDWAYQQGWFRP